MTEKDGLTVARLPEALAGQLRTAAGQAVLRLEVTPLPGGEPNPAAFLYGTFAVASAGPYAAKDSRQWRTKGPFRLTACGPADPADLIASGYPFADEPATFVKTVPLQGERGIAEGAMRLTGVKGAAARVRLDDLELGWCRGPDWSVALPAGLPPGEHALTVELYPSTFNKFGPHRHIDGDRQVTSPAQYEGVKNYADRPDAPERTLGDDWHFVQWGIGGPAEFL
ncbi:hypothetical protein [Cohnella zeiphila]|uniref:Uncharacterized protein n=1 Tax=Cohnella zeiphila TaxID=2761120 RepID=A0A7X0SNM5_9BACL|nr:hypothetical protein [Cohnella zeiphila]MBB6733317.1 hypothetical protein [Cohnella zeiphila]